MTIDCEAAKTGSVGVRSGVAPYLSVEGAAKAADFYVKAFNATELVRMPPDDKGRYMHIHLDVNGASVMLADPFPEHGHPYEPLKGVTLHMQVKDVDAWWDRAVKAGCEIVLPLQLMFWGDNYGQLRDPFGVLWSLAETPTK